MNRSTQSDPTPTVVETSPTTRRSGRGLGDLTVDDDPSAARPRDRLEDAVIGRSAPLIRRPLGVAGDSRVTQVSGRRREFGRPDRRVGVRTERNERVIVERSTGRAERRDRYE